VAANDRNKLPFSFVYEDTKQQSRALFYYFSPFLQKPWRETNQSRRNAAAAVYVKQKKKFFVQSIKLDASFNVSFLNSTNPKSIKKRRIEKKETFSYSH